MKRYVVSLFSTAVVNCVKPGMFEMNQKPFGFVLGYASCRLNKETGVRYVICSALKPIKNIYLSLCGLFF